MNINYVKTLLTTYPRIEKIVEQIDELVFKRAISSFSDFSPCIEIAEKILALSQRKKVLVELKRACDSVFNKLTIDEYDLLDYKYIKRKPKEYYKDFDYSSRSYFRGQNNLVKKIASLFFIHGIDDDWYINNCLDDDYFKNTLKRILNHDSNMNKNKSSRKKKNSIKSVKSDASEVKLKLSA